jgi:hypothetical protein
LALNPLLQITSSHLVVTRYQTQARRLHFLRHTHHHNIITTSLVAPELNLIVSTVIVIVIVIITVISIFIISVKMSTFIPGNVSTYNEEMAPLLERMKRAYAPCDYKTAFKKIMELFHKDELDDCIDAGTELLKQRIPDITRTNVHVVIASCLEDPDEMEEHYKEALDLWTRVNTKYPEGKDSGVDAWLRQTRTYLDVLLQNIEDDRNMETDESDDESDEEMDLTDSTSTPVRFSMSAIATVETVPILNNDITSTFVSQLSMSAINVVQSAPVFQGPTTSRYRDTSPSDVD